MQCRVNGICGRALRLMFVVGLLSSGWAQTVCGDCDLNGQVTITDALVGAQHSAGVVTLAGEGFRQCDVDGGGTVDVLDALLVSQSAAGLPAGLSCVPLPRVVSVDFTHRLSTVGSTRATAYSMSNKIISHGDQTFVAWLDDGARAQVATHDATTGTWSAPVLLGVGTDNHGGPAITMDGQGYLHVVFGPHHAPFQYRRSVLPHDASAWTSVTTIGGLNTYPSLVCDPADTLHLAHRGGADRWRLMYRRKPAGGAWEPARELVNAGMPVTYAQYGNSLAVDAGGTVHLAFHIYDQPTLRGHSVGYLRSSDGGTTWTDAGGAPIATPVTPASSCFLEQGPTLDMRVGSLALDSSGNPWLSAIHIESGTVLLWHHDGATWSSIDLAVPLATHLPGWLSLGATLTFDAQGVLYVAAHIVRPGYTVWYGDPTKEVVLLTSEDDGASFTVLPISAHDPTTANWLASLERPHGPAPIDTPALLYSSGDRAVPPTRVEFVQLTR